MKKPFPPPPHHHTPHAPNAKSAKNFDLNNFKCFFNVTEHYLIKLHDVLSKKRIYPSLWKSWNWLIKFWKIYTYSWPFFAFCFFDLIHSSHFSLFSQFSSSVSSFSLVNCFTSPVQSSFLLVVFNFIYLCKYVCKYCVYSNRVYWIF